MIRVILTMNMMSVNGREGADADEYDNESEDTDKGEKNDGHELLRKGL